MPVALFNAAQSLLEMRSLRVVISPSFQETATVLSTPRLWGDGLVASPTILRQTNEQFPLLLRPQRQ
jgi:hypothetical protein